MSAEFPTLPTTQPWPFHDIITYTPIIIVIIIIMQFEWKGLETTWQEKYLQIRQRHPNQITKLRRGSEFNGPALLKPPQTHTTTRRTAKDPHQHPLPKRSSQMANRRRDIHHLHRCIPTQDRFSPGAIVVVAPERTHGTSSAMLPSRSLGVDGGDMGILFLDPWVLVGRSSDCQSGCEGRTRASLEEIPVAG